MHGGAFAGYGGMMVERILLRDDYSIARVINGLWQLSAGHALQSTIDSADVLRAFHELVERGFTTFDLADIYTGAEEFLGRFVQALKGSPSYRHEDLQIHTKYVPDINKLASLNYADTAAVIHRSLKRLNRERLDVVQFHWWDYEVPGCVETAGHLMRLQEQGKIAHVSVTNFDTVHLKELVDAGIEILSCQSQYSLLDRRVERNLLDYCRANGIHLFCYGTLAGGLLSEKWIGQPVPEKPDNRSLVKYIQVVEESIGWEKFQELLQLLNGIAQTHAVQIAHIATKYILSQPGVAASIIGTRSSRHVASNARIFAFELTGDDIAMIDGFIRPLRTVEGEPFELERTAGSKFRNIMKMNLQQEKHRSSES
ncbi:MAG: aldo/keto reductase [Anaerolineae bacterium]|jgi:aryl-alcohol dehydrogenase-like predicted oxidoreductase|nr:aldo/keto reductase [Anaerolineae bacterium]